jgi:hypothetical protein
MAHIKGRHFFKEKEEKKRVENKEFPISNAVRVKKRGKWRT